jgi:hypothetical protein
VRLRDDVGAPFERSVTQRVDVVLVLHEVVSPSCCEVDGIAAGWRLRSTLHDTGGSACVSIAPSIVAHR